jgi:hypothetical protein
MSDKKNHKYDYNCLMLKFKIPNWSSLIENMIDKEDIYDDGSGSYGIESNPHVTILYGLHENVKRTDFEKFLVPIRHIKCKSSKISIFPGSEFDVVKFDIESNYLEKMNSEIRENCDYTTDFPEYKSNMTIAYVKPGTGKKYVKKLRNPLIITPTDYIYSATDGKEETFFV